MAGLDGAAASTPASEAGVNKSILILIVDPSPFSRACTLAGFNEIPDLTVHASGSLEDARLGQAPEVVIFHDYHRNGTRSNLSAQLREAAEIWPGAAMLVIANPGDREQLYECLEGRARGFLNSNVSIEATVAAIRVLMSNLIVYSDDIFELIGKSANGNGESADVQELALVPTLPGFRLLTPRQQEVLGLLSLGLSNKVIGQQLHISESTVKVHIRGIMAQTGVTNRTQIVAHFLARE
jgi:DNA-binding NarL/FixJ family response regulator